MTGVAGVQLQSYDKHHENLIRGIIIIKKQHTNSTSRQALGR
jgi:hypothetical protein